MHIPGADVLIVGAGPAGLAAAAACRRCNVSYCICEIGNRLLRRNRSDPSSLVQGTGGAGLYSDGKFSFFPSATKLWQLDNTTALRLAYDWFEDLVSQFGLAVPAFEDSCRLVELSGSRDRFTQKLYKSQYLSFDARSNIIKLLEREHDPYMMNGTLARLCSSQSSVDAVACEIEGGILGKHTCLYKSVVFAAGRHGPLMFHSDENFVPINFRYVELGIRIEQSSSDFFLRDQPQLDPSYL